MRFNLRGEIVQGLGRRWLTDDRQVFQAGDDQTGFRIVDQHGVAVLDRGGNFIAAGGGRVAAVLLTSPVQSFSNFGYASSTGYVADVAPDGTAVEIPDYQARNRVGLLGGPYVDFGIIMEARAFPGGFVASFDDGHTGGRVFSSVHGFAALPPGVKPFTVHQVGDLLLYTTHRFLILQSFDRPQGIVVAEAPAFYPDAIQQGGKYLVGWTLTQGDTDLRTRKVDESEFTDISTLSDSPAAEPPPVIVPPQEPRPVPYQRRSPDHTPLVKQIADRFPLEWENARKRPDGTRSDAFIRRFAWEAAKIDPLIGLNGKRGSDEISTDAVAYKNETGPGGVEVIDIITGDHRPAWQDRTLPEGNSETPNGQAVLGKYIAPTDPGPVPEPKRPDTDELAALKAEVAALRTKVQTLERKLGERPPFPKKVALKSAHGRYVCVESDGHVVADRDARGEWETLTIERVE